MFGELYQRPNSKYHRILETCFRFYRRLVFVVLAQYATSAIVSHKPMILSYGETQGLELRLWIFYFSTHTLYIIVMYYLVLGFDGLFFYMVGHSLTEMKMIKVAFGNSNIQAQWNNKKRFRRATEHHIFVLQHVKLTFRIRCLFIFISGLWKALTKCIPSCCCVNSFVIFLPYVLPLISCSKMGK